MQAVSEPAQPLHGDNRDPLRVAAGNEGSKLAGVRYARQAGHGKGFAAGRGSRADGDSGEHPTAGHVYLFFGGGRQSDGQQENGRNRIKYRKS